MLWSCAAKARLACSMALGWELQHSPECSQASLFPGQDCPGKLSSSTAWCWTFHIIPRFPPIQWHKIQSLAFQASQIGQRPGSGNLRKAHHLPHFHLAQLAQKALSCHNSVLYYNNLLGCSGGHETSLAPFLLSCGHYSNVSQPKQYQGPANYHFFLPCTGKIV